jgi:SAM-dependent methyltransferase
VARNDYAARGRYHGDEADYYLARRTHRRKWIREQQEMEKLLAAFPRGSSILDVPFGTGRYLEFYALGDHRTVGLDISREMMMQSRGAGTSENCLMGLVQGEAEALPLSDGAIDYIVCTRLFNWFPLATLRTVVCEFARVAKHGLIIEVRVGEGLGIRALAGSLVRDFARNPWRATRRLFKPLVSGRRGSLHGAKVHDPQDVADAFATCNLEVVEVISVAERTRYLRRQHQNLQIYVLCAT